MVNGSRALAATRRAFSYSTTRVIIRHNSRALRVLNSRPLDFKERPRRTRAYPQGSLAHFGTYSVDAAGTTLTFHVERQFVPELG